MSDLESNLVIEDDIQPKMGASKKKNAKMIRDRILINDNDDIPPTGLFVGLNGRGYLIRTGEEVIVPRGVVGILENARAFKAIVNPRTRQVTGRKLTPRFGFTILERDVKAA